MSPSKLFSRLSVSPLGSILPVVLFLVLGCSLAPAQVAVPVGGGSYASAIPAASQWIGGYYSMSPQQVVTQYANLHISPALTNRPMPSNKWWTDTLIADRSYQPQGGGPRVMQQDAFGGQLWVYPAVVAPNAAGFNLYFPNAWNTQADTNQPGGGFNPGPALPVTSTIPPAVGPNDTLLADFSQPTYPPGWALTGTAFGTGPIAGGSWAGQSPPVQGFIGGACVNTYRGSDSPQGTLTSPSFTVQKNYIHVLAGGGNNTNTTAVRLIVGGNVVRAAAGQNSGTLLWQTWDVSAYLGQTATLQVADLSSGSWGFILCSWVVASDDGSSPAARYTSTFSPTQSLITDWSDWGLRFALPDSQGRRMDIALARGVPFVWTTYTNLNPTINVGASTLYDTNGSAISLAGGSFTAAAFAFDYQGRTFGIFAPDNTTFSVAGGAITAQLSGTNNFLVFGCLPSRAYLNQFAGFAYARVIDTAFDWTYDRTNAQVRARHRLTTAPLKGSQTNTLQGFLPHHYRTTHNSLAFQPYTFLTPRGLMKVAAGTDFELVYDFRGIAPVLPAPRVNHLPNDYVASRMTNYLANFAAHHPNYVGDSYGAGKEMAITAQQISMARQLGLTNQLTQMAASLRALLADWYTYTPGETGPFFALYPNWRALIGFPPGYGSEAFNDNHFHYGYFLAATALLGMEDTSFLTQYAPMARLVARQYANWDRSDINFPYLRTFDPWEGHSNAGGLGSGGGENQESSSEAMNSWVGLFLLGNQLQDDAMTAAGAMGYAIESAAVNEYWQDMYRTNLPASYGKGEVGVVWSGAVAYGTYFSGDPAWIYGIQWVPENHWNNYLARDKAFAQWQLTNMWAERIVADQHGLNGFTLTDANDVVSQGAYLGNYILGFQTLFDPDGVAAIMESAYATNAAIATDATYSGITYYLAHSLRALGDPDLGAWTTLPTSQVYINTRTGQRTVIVYNPAATNQVATIYQQGVVVGTLTLPPRTTVVNASGGTPASRFPTSIQPGTQLSWATTAGKYYKAQWSSTGLPAWSDLVAFSPGDNTTNTLFDPHGAAEQRAYRVLEISIAPPPSAVVNGGFEAGSGSAATNWSQTGSQAPSRVGTTPYSGAYCLSLAVTNPAAVPNNASLSQNIASQGGPAITPGAAYTFSFGAYQVNSGPSLVQNYQVNWLNSGGGSVGSTGWIGFSGGIGFWKQISVNNLVAPANAVNASITIYNTTGAVSNGFGTVLIDDVFLGTAAAGQSQTNQVPAKALPAVQITWPSTSGAAYQVQAADALQPQPAWTNSANQQGTGSTNAFIDLLESNHSRFYRVLQLQ
jgi:endoglucanase Acf2